MRGNSPRSTPITSRNTSRINSSVVSCTVFSSTQANSMSSWVNSSWRSARRASSRSEEHTSELQSLMRISYAVFCLKKKKARYQCYVQYDCIQQEHTHSRYVHQTTPH